MSVCILMPCLNAASFIEVALETVLRQREADETLALRVLVLDGGSSDGTLEILERTARAAPGQMSWISRRDNGPAQALNEGFRLALRDTSTRIVGWLNADDGYAPGAVVRAITMLRAQPSLQMVYGHGMHVDAQARSLGLYPSSPPEKLWLASVEGSPICQPTVFLRREAIEALMNDSSPSPSGDVSLLDESLKTAFDFELWLRLLRRYPDGVGFIDEIQAYSRLHAGCLTLRLRETVALESMRTIARHISNPETPGTAPLAWVRTHIDEICAAHPFDHTGEETLGARVIAFARRAAPLLTGPDREALVRLLRNDQRLRLAVSDHGSQAVAAVQPDGWVSHALAVRCSWTRPVSLSVFCRGAWPHQSPLHLVVRPALSFPDRTQTFLLDATRGFVITLATPEGLREGSTTWWIEAIEAFVPAHTQADSDDFRELSFRVERVEISGAE